MTTGSPDDLTRDRDMTGVRDTSRGDIENLGEPRQPVTDERQHTPDDGEIPVSPEADIMREARDGFMDRYPPRGQTN